MPASIKVKLYTHKTYSDGSHPIVIQVIVNRKAVKVTVGQCKPDQWNEEMGRVKLRKHPNAAVINNTISDEFNRIEKMILSDENISKSQVKSLVVNAQPEEKKDMMLIESLTIRAKHYHETLKIGGYKHYNTVAIELTTFLKKDIPIKIIDKNWLERYIHHLANREKKPNKINTIAKKLEAISSVISYAKKKDSLIENPFDDFTIRKQKVLKQKLTADDLEIFKTHILNTPHQEMCRDIFLFQIYMRGMRIGDVLDLKKSYVIENRLLYEDDKTNKNFNIKLIPQANSIIKKYEGYDTPRIFPLLKWTFDANLSIPDNEFKRKKAIESCTSMVNNVISKIGRDSAIKKKVRSHTARHTFAKMAFDKIQNPRITMGLVGHTSLKIHQGYLEELNNSDELDNANDSIFE